MIKRFKVLVVIGQYLEAAIKPAATTPLEKSWASRVAGPPLRCFVAAIFKVFRVVVAASVGRAAIVKQDEKHIEKVMPLKRAS